MSKLIALIKHDLKIFYYTKIRGLTEREIRINYLRNCGMTIGKDFYCFSDKIETTEPYLISIGDHVTIAVGVSFATHDASSHFYMPESSDLYGRITIGNRVFIGMNAMILPGVQIADDCIIGAGSVVINSCPYKGKVIAGNPAKIICNVADLKEKYPDKCLNTYNMSFEERKMYLLSHEDQFKTARPMKRIGVQYQLDHPENDGKPL